MIEKLPLYYFKPTICWVDDDEIFLDAVNIAFREKYNFLGFSNPAAALDFLESYTPPTSNINIKREFIESDLFDNKNHYPIDVNISAISYILNLSDKSNEIAIVVFDYNMPEINGIEVCKKLKNLPFKKILLTGDVTDEKAVDAFNHGLIDKFIKKSHDVADQLFRYIDELSQLYFYDRTKYLMSTLENSRSSFLTDPDFIKFFHGWCNKNKITDYYLINRHGSFLTKDVNSKLSYFITMSESDKNEFMAIHDDANDKINYFLTRIKSGEMIPFFGLGKESWEFDLSEWQNCLYPAQIIKGKENYYWSVVDSK